MIKGILFDYGGVVAAGGRPGMLSNNLSANLTIPTHHAEELLSYGFDKIKRGLISEEEFWKVLEKAYGANIPAEQRDIWAKWEELVPIPEIIELIKDLNDSDIRTDLLSNTEPPVAQLLREHGAYDYFGKVILSCEVGYAKPDTEIYALALQEIGLQPNECIFVDDQPKMLEPAHKLGIHVIHAQDTRQIIGDIQKAIITPFL